MTTKTPANSPSGPDAISRRPQSWKYMSNWIKLSALICGGILETWAASVRRMASPVTTITGWTKTLLREKVGPKGRELRW